MNKYIVTTTIHPPSKAIILYCKRKDWKFIIVGDTRTPHDAYRKLAGTYTNVTYLAPDIQEKRYKKLSDSIGWGSIQRRNIGFVYAFNEGADIIATVDDDNIPYADWGRHVYVGKTTDVTCYKPANHVFDPLSVTKANHLWHRGYPIELLQTKNNVKHMGKVRRRVLIQADLWDGDPDIDAMARLTYRPMVRYSEITAPYCSSSISPFNSQNTFLAREVFPYYAVLPHIGRMDDIWGGYIVQKYFPGSVIYNKATVFQDRNKQDLVTNLENEVLGYRHTLTFIKDLAHYEKYLPDSTKRFYELYRKSFGD